MFWYYAPSNLLPAYVVVLRREVRKLTSSVQVTFIPFLTRCVDITDAALSTFNLAIHLQSLIGPVRRLLTRTSVLTFGIKYALGEVLAAGTDLAWSSLRAIGIQCIYPPPPNTGGRSIKPPP